MVQRRLTGAVRERLSEMLTRFTQADERALEESDRTILGAMREEINHSDNVKFDVDINTKTGRVTISCNEIKYTFDDPSIKGQ